MSKKNFKSFFKGLVWMISVVALIFSGGTMLHSGDLVQGSVMLIVAVTLIVAGILNGEDTIYKQNE
jgi:hypothetical protein